MWKNYLKIAWRNLVRDKGYTLINVTGLSVGMAAAMLIFLWVYGELEYDRFFEKTDRLYQVYHRDVFNGEPAVWDGTPTPLSPTLKLEYPGIEDATRYLPTSFLLSVDDKNLNSSGAFADSSFFHLFDFEIAEGNKQGALKDNQGIVISKSLAEKLFGTDQALGNTIRIDRNDSFVVTAIMGDMPRNTRFKSVEFLLPWQYLKKLGWDPENWYSNNYYTYVLLEQNAKAAEVNQKIKSATAKNLTNILDNASSREIFLHPASQWHLYSKIEGGGLVGGKITFVRLLALIAVLILMIACVNFINLSTARSSKRAKEVGVRKISGAPKRGLVYQFIGESMILSFLSGIFALIIAQTFIPVFNQLVDGQLAFAFESAYFWIAFFGFVLVTGLLAGGYPAFYLSGFGVASALKGIHKPSKAMFSTRQGLVVLQFTFSIILIIATLVISQQIDHAQKRDRGYEANNLMFIHLSGELQKRYEALVHDLLREGVAVSVSKSNGPFTQLNDRLWGVSWPGSTQADKDREFALFGTDANFLETTGAQLLAGREIDVQKYASDSSAILLNETATKMMGLTDPVGTEINHGKTKWNVVGVVKDFIFASPYEPILPVIVAGPAHARDWSWASVRLNSDNSIASNMEIAERVLKAHNPEYPFEYVFADEAYAAKFTEEQLSAKLAEISTGLAIFISCLGLFGLTAFAARQRTKEIGVRKVLGASVSDVVSMLSLDFMKLILIAFLFATPIAWYGMNQWLEDFAYRIEIQWWMFVIAGLAALALAMLTVSLQSVKAAMMNPVDSLKIE